MEKLTYPESGRRSLSAWGVYPMRWQKLLSVFFISSLMTSIGCSKQILKMPKPLPPIVKHYKHKIIHGDVPGMQSTGIHLNEGDVYSILATGIVDTWPRVGREVGPSSVHFIARIGQNPYFHPILWAHNAAIHTAYESGKLYFGVIDGKMTRCGSRTGPPPKCCDAQHRLYQQYGRVRCSA